VLVSYQLLPGFAPKAEPKKAGKDDPLLKVCYHCYSTEGLSDFHGVSRCSGCQQTMDRYGTITRDLLQSFFGLSKSEADKLPRGTGIAGVYRSIIYKCDAAFRHRSLLRPRGITLFLRYKISTGVKACQKKYGSMFSYLKSKEGRDEGLREALASLEEHRVK